MIIVKIFSSFSTSENCKEVYERLNESHLIQNYGKDIVFTLEDNYTHAIIQNVAMPNLIIPKENVIGFAFEPIRFLLLTDDFINYAQKYIGKYYIGDTTNLPKPFIEHYSYMWHLEPLKYIPVKKSIMSIIISDKLVTHGHHYRHLLVNEILKTDLPIDIYGTGCKFYKNITDSRIKGKFNEKEPYEFYYFHICIENVQSNHYFSEKITNPLLCNTNPIYLGCKNINSYFPDYITNLSGDINDDMILIKNILKEPLKYNKKIDIHYVKDKINLIKHLLELFKTL